MATVMGWFNGVSKWLKGLFYGLCLGGICDSRKVWTVRYQAGDDGFK